MDARWDEYMLKFMESGGNYSYRGFMHYYNIKCKEIYKKYMHKASIYYAKRLRATVDGMQLQVKPPNQGFTFDEINYFISKGIDPQNFIAEPS